MHVHVEQDAHGCLALDDELMPASARNFRSSAESLRAGVFSAPKPQGDVAVQDVVAGVGEHGPDDPISAGTAVEPTVAKRRRIEHAGRRPKNA